jgi:hypothetical protein
LACASPTAPPAAIISAMAEASAKRLCMLIPVSPARVACPRLKMSLV